MGRTAAFFYKFSIFSLFYFFLFWFAFTIAAAVRFGCTFGSKFKFRFRLEFRFDGDLFRRINKWHVQSVNLSSARRTPLKISARKSLCNGAFPDSMLFGSCSTAQKIPRCSILNAQCPMLRCCRLAYLWLGCSFCQPKVPAIYQGSISHYFVILPMHFVWPNATPRNNEKDADTPCQLGRGCGEKIGAKPTGFLPK